MSEYQYYEFQAIDRLLDAEAQAKLRDISSRARITASSFVNSYDWGDLKADPLKLLERYFDLHLYLANWGTRQFAMKLPRRLFEPRGLEELGLSDEVALLKADGEHVMLSIVRFRRGWRRLPIFCASIPICWMRPAQQARPKPSPQPVRRQSKPSSAGCQRRRG